MNSFNQTNIAIIPMFVFRKEYNTNGRKLSPTVFFITFLFRWPDSYQSYIWAMGKNGTLFFFHFFFLLFKEKRNLLLHGYTFFMGNNIVVVQRDTTTPHNKILSWASHILRTYRLFDYVVYYFINFIYAVLALLNSFHIMVQTLKTGEVY